MKYCNKFQQGNCRYRDERKVTKKSRTPLTETRRKKENIKQVKSYKTKLFKNKKTRRGKRKSAKTFSKSLRLIM